MQVIDHTEDYVAEKPCRNRGRKQEARVGVSSDGRRPARQVEAWIRRVPGKQKLFPETLPETGKLREGEKGFSSPPPCPHLTPLCPIGQSQPEPSETQETQPVSQFSHDKEQSKSALILRAQAPEQHGYF